MAAIEKDRFLREFTKAIIRDQAAIFAGAGVSAGAGFVDWRGLLREIASDLRLDVDEEHDLIALAQYEFNQNNNRSRLNSRIVDEFGARASLSELHRWIARLPIDTVWTTNYDRLLEEAYQAEAKTVDVKHRQPDLLRQKPYADVTIFKMHGDVSCPDEAVLIKDDYERYQATRSLFTSRLQGDLTWRQFLFLGFSFTDPNIDYIFARLRCLLEQNAKNQPPRYCILRRPKAPEANDAEYEKAVAAFERETRLLPHRIADLGRFNIDVLLIDEYSEVESLVRELALRVQTKNIFISGSAKEFGPVGQARLEGFGRKLGAAIIARGYNLVSGFGLGVSGSCIIGAHEEVKRSNAGRLGQRLRLHPFPQSFSSDTERKQRFSEIRTELIKGSGVSIFVAGNKNNEAGETVMADGVIEEYQLARQNRHILIPVPATGWAASEVWSRMQSDLEELHPSSEARNAFVALCDPGRTDDEWIAAIFTIVEKRKV